MSLRTPSFYEAMLDFMAQPEKPAVVTNTSAELGRTIRMLRQAAKMRREELAPQLGTDALRLTMLELGEIPEGQVTLEFIGNVQAAVAREPRLAAPLWNQAARYFEEEGGPWKAALVETARHLVALEMNSEALQALSLCDPEADAQPLDPEREALRQQLTRSL